MVKAALAVTPTLKIVFVRIADVNSFGGNVIRPESLISAIKWVSDNADKYSIDAVSLSLSGTNQDTCTNQTTVSSVASLGLKNIPTFAATGNEGSKTTVGFPACVPGVIGVGASTDQFDNGIRLGETATNRGPGLDIVAPGKIDITKYNGSPTTLSGSSGANVISASRYINKNTYLRKSTTKTANLIEDKKIAKKQRIREIIKQPKEKFLTKNQEEYWRILGDNEITLCFGPAGVGKSYIAMKRAVDLLHDDSNKYEKIIIVRPAVEAEEKLGSLPGGLEEKLDPYIYPSYYLLNKIIGKEAREELKDQGYIEVAALAYMRGWNVDNTILVFEEAQNATPSQIKLLLTRIGFNSKFFISGDLEQSDKYRDKTKSGLYDAKMRLQDVKGIGIFEFGIQDIVRNPIIGEILNRYD